MSGNIFEDLHVEGVQQLMRENARLTRELAAEQEKVRYVVRRLELVEGFIDEKRLVEELDAYALRTLAGGASS
jgi:hypothetical protein